MVIQTPLQNSPQTNLVWTDFMSEEQFGRFRFGIGIGPDLSTNMNEATSSPMHVSGTEKLSVTVTAETNKSDVRLAITSCKHVSKDIKAKSYFIQDGCLDNEMVVNMTRDDNKIVFTLHLSGLAQISGSSTVFISCEVKLCLDSNHSESCGFYCPLQLFSKQPSESVLETRTYHITTKPIYVIWESRKNGKY
ncbi:hypothetical protein GDO78_003809 [Eleutherodactylus coqui]|uniref:ZP domain-containing protein n=1 Tax=Eleutherodactylus coqui TaxID=57060 RepID=A0A8J6EV88_ELECQ|nr:hypothetical protein GDO78_003809 [Eleutherodactylus coqui]